jgi:hypothetical protein
MDAAEYLLLSQQERFRHLTFYSNGPVAWVEEVEEVEEVEVRAATWDGASAGP